MAARPDEAQDRPEVGDTLLVIHEFIARSSDELSLATGDRVELIERDDEFGDGWFLGKHLGNENSGLFPQVYTRPAPKNQTPIKAAGASKPLINRPGLSTDANSSPAASPAPQVSPSAPSTVVSPTKTEKTPPVTLPLNSAKKEDASEPSVPPTAASNYASLSAFNHSQDSHVLNETLNVIDEHITDLRSPPSTGNLRAGNDSGSEYSAQVDHRLSYIQGEETDEEEDAAHTRPEVEAWTPDRVAEHLFTAGVEKKHCEVFRDQEISGEVLLGMDQSSLFIKAFDLGSVGRRLKTWQKIKALQDECNNPRSSTKGATQTYGSETGSDSASRTRSRTSTLTNSVPRPPVDDRTLSIQAKRLSAGQTPQPGTSPASSIAHDSPTRATHVKRPSAASIRELNHSRRHSSTNDYRLTGTTVTNTTTPSLTTRGTFPQTDPAHKKQPSFDRNWTMGSAFSHRPVSSTGLNDIMQQHANAQESATDPDRGYFSGTEADGKRRNVLRKRDSGAHSRKSSYADEQRVRSATAISRHSRYGSIEARESMPSPAAQKYYGMQGNSRPRTGSVSTTSHSIRRVPSSNEAPSPTVTKLDGSARESPLTPTSPMPRHGGNTDWLSTVITKPAMKLSGLRATSDTTAGEHQKMVSPGDTPLKESPLESPVRTQSSTPSAGPSFELDSPNTAKSPLPSANSANKSRKKGKKETSAYQRGLQSATPQEAMKDADYSGWMKKKSNNLMTTWKPRLFVLKGRRLAYYYSEDDEQEKGLIDVSFHRVLPADNEKLTGLHATLTGAGSAPGHSQSDGSLVKGDDAMFIFKLVPPRSGLSRAVNFTKPTVHYFAVPNLQQGRLWMAALMKATIDRDDTTAITTTYQQKTISLAKARALRHRPPALMNLDESPEDDKNELPGDKVEANFLGIHFGEADSGVSGLDKIGVQKAESASAQKLAFGSDTNVNNDNRVLPPQSA